jgi:tRNA (cytidine/uridine-2'-O-)-methyltransferase
LLKDHLHICLFQPEIPQNTGSIARLAAATGCRLHLIKPFGFNMSDRNLRRPGLDYWPFLDLEIHESLDDFLSVAPKPVAFLSKFGTTHYTSMPSECQTIIFGQETKGLPEVIRSKYAESLYRIPMFHPQVRSLNLANAASILVYHQLEKRGTFVKDL